MQFFLLRTKEEEDAEEEEVWALLGLLESLLAEEKERELRLREERSLLPLLLI